MIPAKPEVCEDAMVVRKATRFASIASTCSTAITDSQPEPGEVGSEGDASLEGQVWLLSQDPRGCRQVQAALEAATSNEAREALAAELHGHVAKAMRCPHANHVLQKCIALLRPEALQFVVDELLAREGLAVQAAKHRYACRVVQHTLGRCPSAQAAELFEALLREVKVLACHTIGHYTVEQLLEVGTEDQRYRLVRAIEQNVHSIGLCTPGAAVLRAALTLAAPEDQIWIARAVFQHEDVLLTLASERHGSAAVLQAFQVMGDREHKRAREALLKHLDKLQSTKFGWAVAQRLASIGSRGA